MIPARYAQILFALVLSGMMSFVVTCVAVLRSLGPVDGFMWIWLSTWLFAWAVAFPTAVFVAPFARRLVARLTQPPG